MLRPLAIAPRERLLSFGSAYLSDTELIALVLGTGRAGEPVLSLAERVAREVGELRTLSEIHPQQLTDLHGLGAAKAARLAAAVELGRRVCRRPWRRGEAFTSSRQVFGHYHAILREEKREIFIAAYLDARNRLIGEREISRGSLVASLVHPREVLRPAIRLAAASMICVHNHPSGDPRYSAEDVAITSRLRQAGCTVGIELLDHVIVGESSYCSFADQGIEPFGGGRAGECAEKTFPG